MSQTIVGLFSSTAAAQQVKQALVGQGYPDASMTIIANDDEELSSSSYTGVGAGTGVATGEGSAHGIGYKVGKFFSSLTGGDEHAHSHYTNGVNAGGALLSVETNKNDADVIAALLRQHGAQEIDSSSYSDTTAYGKTGTAEQATGTTAIPIVEEQLVVGKREVDRGGVRVYSRVVETPAEAEVVLRDERINVERIPVNREATAADYQTGGAFEVRASGEEAVVGKSSKVVEEVVVGKQATERTQAIQDTLRKTEVEVEQVAGDVTKKSSY